MSTLKEDLDYAWRGAIKKPAISLLIIITFGLGIGANSAIFSMVYHVMFAPLPYADGERLVRLQQHQPIAERMDFGSSVQSFFDYRRMTNGVDTLVEYHAMQFTLLGHGAPKRIQTGVVSWNYFSMLGIQPILGRDFAEGEDEPGAEPLILLSHDYWIEQFGQDPNIVGTSLEMNNAVHKVIGVLPPIPAYPDDNDIYISAASCPFRSSQGMINNRRPGMLQLFGKLESATQIEQASDEVNGIANQLATSYPDDYPQARGYSANFVSMRDEMVGDSAQTFYLLLAISGLVVLIASANVANLNLARLSTRTQELAIREALGADPRRVARLLLTESISYAFIGGLLGILVAYPSLSLLSDFATRYTPLASEVKLDFAVIAFSLGISVLAGLISGSAAAFSKRNINDALKEGGDKVTTSTGGKNWRQGLLVVQLALAFIILTVSGLVTLSLYNLSTESTGFNDANVLAVNMDLNFTNYSNAQEVRDFSRTLLRDIEQLPGAERVSISGSFPLASNVLGPVAFETESQGLGTDDVRPQARVTVVTEGFHRVLGIPLLEGRLFQESDDENNPQVVLINRTMAEQYFSGSSPIGQRLSIDNGQTWADVVGVVGDVRATGLNQTEGSAFYASFMQNPTGSVRLLVKSNIEPKVLQGAISDALEIIDPQQAIASAQTLAEAKQQWLASPRLMASLIGLFGLLALFITLSGVIGVVAYSVSQRFREIGIRIAIGATPGAIFQLLIWQGSKLVFVGLGIGLVAMPIISPSFSDLLYQTHEFVPLVYTASFLVLLTATLFAIASPARQAIHINPNNALRNQ
jgi:predicted permease